VNGLNAASALNVVFAGTPEFASLALGRIHAAGHHIRLVLTQPDRPAGRGMQLQASAVKQFALAHGLAVAQPRSLRLDGKYPEDAALAREALQKAGADVMVVAAYGLILPQWVLDLPRWGCLNIHGSLLPRWRGAAPIHRAIEAGDTELGVTIMQMDAGLDTGDMLLWQSLPIDPEDTTGSLHDKVAALGAGLIVDALAALPSGSLRPQRQPQEGDGANSDGITYAHKITRQEAVVDWTQDAALICRRVRAFNPFPVAVAQWAGEALKIWRAEVLTDGEGAAQGADVPPGTIVSASAQGIVVVAGKGCVRLLELQRPGGKRLPAGNFLRGHAMPAGGRFDAVNCA